MTWRQAIVTAVVVALVAAVVLVIRAVSGVEAPPPDVAGAPVGDLCAVVPATLVARVAPEPRPEPELIASRSGDTVTPGKVDSDASCAWTTGSDPADDGPYGSLAVRVVRHGGVGPDDAPGRSRESFDDACADPTSTNEPLAPVPGLGDAACLTVNRESRDGTVFFEFRMRRGLDVFRVRGFTNPSDEATTTADVRAVAGALLGGVR